MFLTRPRERQACLAALLLILVFAAYSNSFQSGFEVDSHAQVLENPAVQSVSMEHLRLIFQKNYWHQQPSPLYRPLVTLSWLFNYAVLRAGDQAAGYHWFNLIVHALNVLLVWGLGLTVWRRELPSFFTAAVFALHPVNTEAVTNIAGRADLMAGFALIGGLLVHVRWGGAPGRGRLLWLAGAGTAAFFGVFSKENAIILPAAMLLYDVAFRPRDLRSRGLWRGYLATLPAMLLMAWARRWILAHEPTPDILFVDNPLLGADFLTARLTAMTILWKYVGLLAWPRWLSCDYSYNQIPMASPGAGLAALAAILALLSLAAWLYRRSPQAFFFVLFFFLALAPTANVFLMIGTIMAERLLYLPSIGFAGCLAAVLFAGAPRRATLATAAFLGLATIAFGWRTYQRNFDWSEGQRLWLSASEVCPNSFKAVLGPLSGTHTFTADNIDAAVGRAERGVAIVGGLPPELSLTSPFLTLGTLYRFKGDLSGAVEFYHKALDVLQRAVPIDRAVTERNRARELRRGRSPDRIPDSGSSALYVALAETFRRLGRFDDALGAYAEVLRLAPLDAETYRTTSELNLELGRTEAGIIPLWQSFLIGAHPLASAIANEPKLVSVYRSVYPDTCAVTAGRHLGRLNLDCPRVKAHVRAAYAELVLILKRTGRPDEAGQYKVQGFQASIDAPHRP